MSRTRADLGLVLVTLIWGLTFPAIRNAMNTGATPMAFVAARFFLAALLIFPLARAGLEKHKMALLFPGFVLGLSVGGAYGMQTIGMTSTTASNSGFITGTSVVMVPFLDAAIRRTKLTIPALVGAALALGGVYVLSEVDHPRQFLEGRPGDLWTLASAFSYAVYIVLLQKELSRFDHRALLWTQLVIVALVAAILAPITESPTLVPSPQILGTLAFLAVFVTLGTGLLQMRCQAHSTPVRAALIFALEPVFAAGFAAALLGERIGVNAFVGGAMIVAGVLSTDLIPLLASHERDRRGEPPTDV